MPDPQTKSIATHGCGAVAWVVFSAGKYAVEDNRPVEVVEVVHDGISAKLKM